MPDFAVKIPFIAKDQVSSVLDKMAANTKQYATKTHKELEKINRSALTTKKVFGAILGARVVSTGIMYARMAINGLVDDTIELDKALVKTSARFGFEKGSKEFYRIQDSMKELGKITKFSLIESTQGLDFFAKAGHSLDDSLNMLPATLKLAQAADLEFSDASNIANDALGTFSLGSKDFVRVSNVLAMAANESNLDILDLYETMKLGAPTIHQMNGDIETFAALAMPMANAGIKGSIAATAMKTGFLNLVAPIGKAKDALTEIGMKTSDSKGQFYTFSEMIGQLQEKLNKMTPAKRIVKLEEIFGKWSISGMSTLLEQSVKDFDKTLAKLRNSAEYTENLNKNMMGAIDSYIRIVKNSFMSLGTSITTTYDKEIRNTLTSIAKKIQDIKPKDVIETINNITNGIKKTYDVIVMMSPVLKGIVLLWANYRVYAGSIVAINIVGKIYKTAAAIIAMNTAMRGTKEVFLGKQIYGGIIGINTEMTKVNKTLLDSVKQVGYLPAAFGLVASAIVGAEIGTLIYNEFIKPLINAYNKLEKIKESLNQKKEVGFDKYSKGSNKKSLEDVNKLIDEQRSKDKENMALYANNPILAASIANQKINPELERLLEQKREIYKALAIENPEESRKMEDWEIDIGETKQAPLGANIKIETKVIVDNKHEFIGNNQVKTTSKTISKPPKISQEELGYSY